MVHFVCSGECSGVSETPMACGMKDCSKYNHPLIKCDCADNSHKRVFQVSIHKKNSVLIITAGLPGTGKTTVSKKIAQALNFVHIDQNDVRRKLGMKKMPQTQDKTLREIDKLVSDYLRSGKNVIVDSVHRYMFRRQQLYGVASGNSAGVLVVECVCSPEEAKRRMRARPKNDGLLSDPNNPKVYDKLEQLWEDIIEYDFKYPGCDHVSYITYNTENGAVEGRLIQRGMKQFISQVKEILASN